MTKETLTNRVSANMTTTKGCLQTLWDNINKGQQKQIIKNADIKAMFDRYGVEYSQ